MPSRRNNRASNMKQPMSIKVPYTIHQGAAACQGVEWPCNINLLRNKSEQAVASEQTGYF